VSEPDDTPAVVEPIPDALDGERVDRLVALVTGCSRAEASTLVGNGDVQLDGDVVTKASHRVHAGQVLALLASPERPVEQVVADPSVEVPVVAVDEEFLVVDKPAGMVVHPGAGHGGSTMVHGLLARYPELADVGEAMRPGLVHRLDRGTSGLLVVARTPEAYEALVDQLSSHTVARVYTALTWGHFEHPQGVVDAPIGRSRRDPLRMTVAVHGRPSRTHYRVDRPFDEPVAASLMTCELETGRTHQIRVHMASVGHAVVGDDLYGGVRHSFEVPRPFLHARHLEFVHPGSGEVVAFDSPLPAELQQVLDRLS
jgi:23S rRNA pseudouridine1911/1915/1917 synthase